MALSNSILEEFYQSTEKSGTIFNNSDTIDVVSICKASYEFIMKHQDIINVLAENKTNTNGIRNMGAFLPEEALMLKTILGNAYNIDTMNDILERSYQFKNLRVICVNKNQETEYPYSIVNFFHDGEVYVTLIIIEDFYQLDDEEKAESIRDIMIWDLLDYMYCISLKKLSIPMKKSDGEFTILLPYLLSPSDTKFILHYYSYLFKALSIFLPRSIVERIISTTDISVLISDEVLEQLYLNCEEMIDCYSNPNAYDVDKMIDIMYNINMSYYLKVVNINNDLKKMMTSANSETDDDMPLDEEEDDDA